jgi:hypothetical protein
LGYSAEAKVGRDGGVIIGGNEETIMLIGHWQYIGRGHPPREAIFARAIARDLSENRRLVRHICPEEEASHDRT